MKPPLLYVDDGKVMLATNYRKAGHIEVTDPVDITAQFVAIAGELDEDWWNAKYDEEGVQ